VQNKKVTFFCLGLCLLLLIIAGCGGGSTPAKKDQYPSKPVNVIVSFAAGGGTDLGARVLLPFVEKNLGGTMNVVNKPGGGGWVGWTELLNGEANGYTIAYVNTPNLMTGYLNPEYKRTKTTADFDLIANHVVDYGAIAINVKETRFTNLKELIEYAKKNEVTGSTTGVASDDHIAMLRVNKVLGTKFVAVHTKGASDGKAGVMGGHIDLYVANVGEVTVPHKNKELKVIAVMAPQRSKFLPDVPTFDEVGAKGIYSWSARGIAAKKGLPKDVLDKLVNAFEAGMKDSAQVKKMEEMGLEVKFMKGDEYRNFLKSEEDGVKQVFDLLGWKK
jgi:tripartite-type tricarboxylate transporter receptor subunit TctC